MFRFRLVASKYEAAFPLPSSDLRPNEDALFVLSAEGVYVLGSGTVRPNMQARIATSVLLLSSNLETWQKSEASNGRDVSMCGPLKPETCGSWTAPKFLLISDKVNLSNTSNLLAPYVSTKK